MIIAPIEYDIHGNVLVPIFTDPPPPPSNHLNNTPGVIHRHVFVRHDEEEFEEAHKTALALLATNEGFMLLEETPTFALKRGESGMQKNFYMELLYAIDPHPVIPKRSLLARIFG